MIHNKTQHASLMPCSTRFDGQNAPVIKTDTQHSPQRYTMETRKWSRRSDVYVGLEAAQYLAEDKEIQQRQPGKTK
jgi:hypothetical protein